MACSSSFLPNHSTSSSSSSSKSLNPGFPLNSILNSELSLENTSFTFNQTLTETPTIIGGAGVWNPSLHPLFNLAVLSEQILLPTPSSSSSSLQYRISHLETATNDKIQQHERKRKRDSFTIPSLFPPQQQQQQQNFHQQINKEGE